MNPIVLRLARDDLRETWERLSEYGESPPKQFRLSFEKFSSQVSDMPDMFSRYEHNPIYRRAVLAYGYLVFYQVEKASGRVKIYRVLHGKRDVQPLLES